MLELDQVVKHYTDADEIVRAVDELTLTIQAGRVYALYGPSGSGKTTLLQLLGALDRATEGSVMFEDRELNALDEEGLTSLRSEQIGFVFQHFNLIPTLTAQENVEIAMVPVTRKRAERRTRAGELLELVGLAARADHLPSRLSGGEQQRVAMARALANSPRVVLADEPTGNLDSSTADEVVSALRSLSASQGVTLILVTHAEDVACRADRRIRMRDGKLRDDTDPNVFR